MILKRQTTHSGHNFHCLKTKECFLVKQMHCLFQSVEKVFSSDPQILSSLESAQARSSVVKRNSKGDWLILLDPAPLLDYVRYNGKKSTKGNMTRAKNSEIPVNQFGIIHHWISFLH